MALRAPFAIMRGSAFDRMHVATFNADISELYNRDNCDRARMLFQTQPGVGVKFFCEKGRYRK